MTLNKNGTGAISTAKNEVLVREEGKGRRGRGGGEGEEGKGRGGCNMKIVIY